MFVIVSRNPAFGTLYLGRTCPVKSKSAALKFSSEASATDRVAYWKRQAENGGLDTKFFGAMVVEKA